MKKIAFWSINCDDEITKWLSSEALSAEIELLPIDKVLGLEDKDGLYVVGVNYSEPEWNQQVNAAKEAANSAVSNGIPVIWAVENETFPGAYQSFDEFTEAMDVTPLLRLLLTFLQIPSSDKKAIKKEKNITVIKPVSSVNNEFSHVLAVAGPSGCGTSFLCWNLAALLDAVLIDAKPTGTLARWLGITTPGTRKKALEAQNTPFGVTADEALSDNEIELIKAIKKPVVVDCGTDLDGIYQKAGTRWFVVTPDPQHRDIQFPQNAYYVLNRYPSAFPTPAAKIFNQQMDLIVPDSGREAFLRLWAKNPWIFGQGDEIRDKWLGITPTGRGSV